MRLRELELLHALLTFRSVSDAARALHMSQPNASKTLKKLEEGFGFRVFERVRGRLEPTAEARLLLDSVERATLSLKSFNRLVEDIRELRSGRLTVAALPLLSRRWLPGVIARFMAAHPGVAVSFHTRSSRKLVEWVAERQVDVAVAVLTLDDPLVERAVLTPLEFVVAMPRGHPLERRPEIRARDLDGQRYVSLGVLDHARQRIDRALAAGRAVPDERAECSLPAVALELVEHGVGVALVDHVTASEYRGDGVCFRPFRPRLSMDVWLLRPRMRPRSRIVDAFLAALRDELAAGALAPAAALFG